jgi:hypothetical protein
MRSGTKIVRFCALLAAFVALAGMAGCPQSSDYQTNRQRTDGPPDHSGPDGRMEHGTGGGMGGMP